MSAIVGICVASLNGMGRAFCEHAVGVSLQAGVLIVVLLCIDLLLRNRIRATVRYWIWMLVFVKLVLPPSLAVPTGIGYWLGRYVPSAPAVPQQVVETVTVPAHVEAYAPAEMIPVQPSHSMPLASEWPEPTQADSEPLTWQGGVFVLWCVGVLTFAGLVIQRWFSVTRLIARGEPAQDDLLGVLDECVRRMGIRRTVDLKLSPKAFSPAVCGLFRPTILIPVELLERLSPPNLKMVLIHELAHVKRGDLRVCSLQTLLQIVYFYNPLVWLVNAIVRRVREQAVDEMVLVALGAEARSYSTTLIEIAEMAFLRASPALRLVGVAESRKSLEGRIKNMVTRPIPKSGRVGLWGLCAIVATAVVLLPMARAQNREAPDGSLVARLPGGVTVELLGICNWPPEGRRCWRPDGTKLSKEIFITRTEQLPGPHNYGFMVQVAGPQDLAVRWRTIDGATGWEGSCLVEDSQGEILDRCTAAISDMEAGKVSTAIRIGVAAGAWSTILSHDGKNMYPGNRTGVLWSRAFEDSDGTYIVASAEWRKDRAERIVAVDSEDRVHTGWCGSIASGHVDQYTASFRGLRPDQIKQFLFQVRPYEWAQFDNVSLRRGRKTVVTIKTAMRDNETHADAAPAAGDDVEAFRSYTVNRRVADFPQGEDFSTPEAAYATIHRMDQGDSSAWQRVSVARLSDRLGREGSGRRRAVDPEWTEVLFNARIREVLVWNLTRAAVMAELPEGAAGRKVVDPIDARSFQLQDGRWLNTGNGRFRSTEDARTHFTRRIERETALSEAMRDPLRHAGEIEEAAAQLFERLHLADYADILSHYRDGAWDSEMWQTFPTCGLYTVRTDYPSFALWCCEHFKDNPIIRIQLGDVFIGDALVAGKTGWPTVPYRLTLKDGTILAGNLPFQYVTDQGKGRWQGMEGIDWHLWPSGTR